MKKLILILVLGLVSCEPSRPPFVIHSAFKAADGLYNYTIWTKGWNDMEFVSPEQYRIGDTIYFTTNKYAR